MRLLLPALLLACAAPPPETEFDCADGLDEDLDEVADCDDDDCAVDASRMGACTNDDDLAIYVDFDGNAEWNNCVPPAPMGRDCFGDVECNTTCIHENTGLSQECSGCFGEFIQCFIVSCAGACAQQPPTEACGECVETNCGGGFRACFGEFTCPFEYGCADTVDNDEDGLVDGDDPDCE